MNMNFNSFLNSLGHLALRVDFTPVWKPYEGGPVFIGIAGLTNRDRNIALVWAKSLLKDKAAIWQVEGREEIPSSGTVLYTGDVWSKRIEKLSGFYKVLVYANNTSHFASLDEEGAREDELVILHKAQKKKLWENRGDYDLQVMLKLREGMSLELAEKINALP